jgi:acyl carrier protein|tara:strand:- start:656 stop:892 length:237 start_codon:yes stop_codon:yes gene_type:complete
MINKVIEIIKESLDPDPELVITPETDIIMELDGDSLDVIEIVIDIEEHFDISIAEDDLQSVRYIKDLIELVQEQLDQK